MIIKSHKSKQWEKIREENKIDLFKTNLDAIKNHDISIIGREVDPRIE